MSEYVIVRINEKLIPEFQLNYNASENIAKKSKISSWSDIKVQKNQSLTLILSSNNILNTEVKIPSKNEEVIRQSMPYALEEELANDIDDNHFAYRQKSEQQFIVSIVNKDIMYEIINQINDADLKCTQLYSEIYTIPSIENFTSFCILEDYVIIRDGYTGSTIRRKLIGDYLKLSKNTKQVVYSQNKLKLVDNSSITLNRQDTTLLQAKTLIANMTSAKVINLFQGDYQQDIDAKKSVNPWKKLIVLSIFLMGSWLFINLFQLWKLSSEINTIKDSQSALLIELIPNASQTEINDPYSAIQSRLKLSKNQQSVSGGVGFIKALSYLGQTLDQHPTIQVQSLRQRNTKLEVKLLAQNVNLLNQFQSSLEKNVLSMRIKTGTRDASKDGISSVITMEQL
ncbi:MAG: hypothetical protein JKY19_04285 [Alcanivoracaceae bacterium]|nr:hypothetical protein [Alcanivoracaceae bacterium]